MSDFIDGCCAVAKHLFYDTLHQRQKVQKTSYWFKWRLVTRLLVLPLYDKHKASVAGIVTLHRRSQDTFGKDMELLVSHKLTFDEAMASPVFSLMPRQRLKIIQKSVFEQLDALSL